MINLDVQSTKTEMGEQNNFKTWSDLTPKAYNFFPPKNKKKKHTIFIGGMVISSNKCWINYVIHFTFSAGYHLALKESIIYRYIDTYIYRYILVVKLFQVGHQQGICCYDFRLLRYWSLINVMFSRLCKGGELLDSILSRYLLLQSFHLCHKEERNSFFFGSH